MNNKKNKNTTIKLIIILLLIPIIFNTMIFTTSPNEYKVVRQFGSIVRIVDNPGASFKLPFIQNVISIPKDIRIYDIPASNVITSDKKTMIIDSYVLWRVVDPKKYISTLSASISNTENRIDTIVYNSTKNTISRMSQDEVIQSRDGKINITINNSEDLELKDVSTDKKQQQVEILPLSEEIMNNINSDNLSQYGIEILKIDVKTLDLPDANKEAVYSRMISERDNIAAAYTAQGQSEAKKIRNQTDKEVTIMISEAEAKAEKLEAEGEAEYMKILSDAYNDSEKAEFYTFVRSLDALKESLKGGQKTIILPENSPITEILSINY